MYNETLTVACPPNWIRNRLFYCVKSGRIWICAAENAHARGLSKVTFTLDSWCQIRWLRRRKGDAYPYAVVLNIRELQVIPVIVVGPYLLIVMLNHLASFLYFPPALVCESSEDRTSATATATSPSSALHNLTVTYHYVQSESPITGEVGLCGIVRIV